MERDKEIKNKIYTNFLLFILSFIIFYFLVFPLTNGKGYDIFNLSENNIKKLNEKKDDLIDADNKSINYISKIKNIENNFKEISSKQDFNNILRMIPDKADPVEIINELFHIALKHKIEFSSPGFSDDKNNVQNAYNTLTINFSVKANYASFKSFLYDLENSKRIFNIKSINFSTSQDTKDTSLIDYKISLETYYLKK